MKKNSFATFLYLCVSIPCFCQVGINTISPSATLDIVSKENTSTTKALEISNSDNTEIFTILNNGNVGIGTSQPSEKLFVMGTITSVLQDQWDNINSILYSDTKFPVFNFKRARGNTVNTSSYPTTGDKLGVIAFKNHIHYNGAAEITGLASESHNASQSGGELQLLTTQNGSNMPDIRVKITNDGKVGILPANSSFGGGVANNPNSTLQVYGSVSAKIRNLSSGNVLSDDYTILVQGSINLPAADNTNIGRIYNLINDSSNSNTVNGTFRINGGNFNNYTLNNTDNGRGITVQSNGSSWVVLDRY